MPITRRQQAGLEPMVKLPTKTRNSKNKKKSVHNNLVTMILLMPLYSYMNIRKNLEKEDEARNLWPYIGIYVSIRLP